MGELKGSTRIIFGPDGLKTLSGLAGRRVLVVSDSFLAKAGLLERVTAHLSASQIEIFDQVAGEPTLELVARGVAALERLDAQAVVAFGGGSAMDCAKALGYCAGRRVPLWCIPTTAGTGSEVTAFSVLTDQEKGVKYPLVDDSLVPEVAILDSSFLAGVPPQVTADTGMDVLTHAAEALTAVKANALTDAWAEKAFVLAYEGLPAAREGDARAQETMLMASTMAGLAFNAAGLGACHAIAHALGGALHAPHGRINGLLLPYVIEANSKVAASARKYAGLAKLCGLGGGARSLAGAIRRLGRRLAMPARLDGEGVDVGQVARNAMADPCMADNVKTFTEAEITAILREIL